MNEFKFNGVRVVAGSQSASAVRGGLIMLPLILLGCGKQPATPKISPPASSPSVTATPSAPVARPMPETPSSSAAPAGPLLAASGEVWTPYYTEPAIAAKVRDLANRTVKLGVQSSNAESYIAFQTRYQEWNRALIRAALGASTSADSPQRTLGAKLVEITTQLEPTDADKTAAAELYRQASEDAHNPILDMEYARFLVSTSKLMIDQDQGRLIWTLMSRSWGTLPQDTSPLLKMRYLASHEMFSRRGGQPQLIGQLKKSLVAEAKKIIPAVLEANIPDAEQRFLFSYLRDTAVWTYARGNKFEPISENETNRWLKLMTRARVVAGDLQGATPQQPGNVNIQRACLMAAWFMHPEWPEAATELIVTVNAIGGTNQESPRFWFDEATLAQFDFLPAYEAYLETMPNPAGKSALFAKMGIRDPNPVGPAKAGDRYMDFAIECLDAGRFETQVPTFIITQLDPRPVIGSPYEARLRDAMTNYMASPKITAQQRQRYQSHLAMLDWRSGKYESAEKRIAEMGSDIDVFTFNNAGASIAQVMEECAARGKTNTSTSQPGSWHTSNWRRILNVGQSGIATRFSSNGKEMAVGGPGGLLQVWDTEKWTSVSFKGESHRIRCLDFSQDGKTLVTISEDFEYDSNGNSKLRGGGIILWDVTTGKIKTRLTHLVEPSTQSIGLSGWSVRLSPDGKTLYSGHSMWAGQPARNCVVMWNLTTSQIWNASSESKPVVRALALTSDGRILVAGGEEGKVRGWEIPSERDWPRVPGSKQLLSSFTLNDPKSLCQSHMILSMAFHPNDKWLAIGMSELAKSRFELWDVTERRLLGIADGGHIAFSPNGKLLAAATFDRQIALYDVPGCEKKTACMNAHTSSLDSIAFHPSGSYLIATSEDGTISFWDPDTGKPAAMDKAATLGKSASKGKPATKGNRPVQNRVTQF
jgi:WD40 repeat protein